MRQTSSSPAAESLGDWLRRATGELAAAGFESAAAEAQQLAAHGLRCSWSDLWSRLREPAPALDALLNRRLAHEPLAYITGTVLFCGVEIACGPQALVPRPETETLVEVTLENLRDVPAPAVADIGTGTGAVAAALGKARPDAEVWATDLSADALSLAARNAPGAHLALGDLYDALPDGRKFDAVVSNPPYVAAGDEVAPDVRREPPEAVFAGPTGDEVVGRLIAGAGRVLKTGGLLAFEVGTPEQAARSLERVSKCGKGGVRNDHTGRPRVVWVRWTS